jgi:hypothetical protein
MSDVVIKDFQGAIDIANQIERYEAAVKQMKEALKLFVDTTGLPVDTGEKIWDFSLTESWGFTPETLKSLAAEILLMGYNPWEHLELGSKAISKLNLTNDVLSQYGKIKVTKRFSSKKSPAESEGKIA